MNKKGLSLISLLLLMIFVFSIIPAKNAAGSFTAQAPTPTPAAIPVKDRWDLEAIYADTPAWEKDFALVKDRYLPKYKNYEGKLNDPAKLLELFNMDTEASRILEKIYVYAAMKKDEDNTNSKFTEMSSRISSLYNNVSSAASYVRPELIALPQSALESYSKDSRFASYKFFFSSLIKAKEHTLGKEEEIILAMSSDMAGVPETIATKIREADIKFPEITDSKTGKKIQLSEDEYGVILGGQDRDLRKQAFIGMITAYDANKYALAAALDGQVRKDIFYAKTRKYSNALEASVEGANIPVSVYNSLITATEKNLSALQKYISLRKNILGLDKVHSYDLLASLVGGYEKTITFDETKTLLNKTLAPLGSDYLSVMNNGFLSRWIDVYPAENKTSGAYAWGSYDTHPYILSNYTNDINSMLTTAHEMGHAMNSYYSNKNQPYINSSVPTFTAEIASTTNELLTLKYLLQNSVDDNERLFYLDKMAEKIRGTFFTQVMYAEFEKQIHDRVEAGDALSVESLNAMWGDLCVKFYGPDFELDELARENWLRIRHFYYNFYVYQYATGLAAANQFAADIAAKKPGSAENYIKFLSSGSVDYPVEILKTAGVDMTSSVPVDSLMLDFKNILNQMETILIKQGKIKK